MKVPETPGGRYGVVSENHNKPEYLIQIVGQMSAEFNTMMKQYGKLAAKNYAHSNPIDE